VDVWAANGHISTLRDDRLNTFASPTRSTSADVNSGTESVWEAIMTDEQRSTTRVSRARALKMAVMTVGAGTVVGSMVPDSVDAASASTASNYVAVGPEPSTDVGFDANKQTNSTYVFGVGVSSGGRTIGVAGAGPNIGVYGTGTIIGVSAYSSVGSAVLATTSTGIAVQAIGAAGVALSAANNSSTDATISAINQTGTAISATGSGPAALEVTNTANKAIKATGSSTGVDAEAQEYGVVATATPNQNNTGTGVVGSGMAIGVVGQTIDTDGEPFGAGIGVSANGGTSGTGLYATSSSGYAVQAVSTNARGGDFTGGTYGVAGQSENGVGVYGYSAHSYGLQGQGDGSGAVGVYGQSMDATGIIGETFGSGAGVEGNSRNNTAGVLGTSYTGAGTDLGSGAGVHGISGSGPGLHGASSTGYGAEVKGGLAPLRLVPASTVGPPTSGAHLHGELYADKSGNLYFCTKPGSPGIWKKVQLG
jgi:hypothetical protein